MSDVISFNCSGCGKPYRVATSYAGREFACKQCGTLLCVPQPGQQAGLHIDAEVELGSGGEVMRSTASGRRVVADPTRVFVKQRETSNRMAAVGPGGDPAPKSRAGLLIALVLIFVLAGAGLGGAWAAGLLGSTPAAANPTARTGNTPDQAPDPVKEETARERILKQLDVPGQNSRDLLKLLEQAEQAGLESGDLLLIGRKAVDVIGAEDGAGYTDAELMALAARMEKLNAMADAASLYGLVLSHNRGKPEKSPQFEQAHRRLGHHLLDFESSARLAVELRDSGLIEGMDKLHDEVLTMEKRADEGWALLAVTIRLDEINKLLGDGRAELDRILADEPWRLKVAEAERLFKAEKAGGIGTWVTFWRDPFVIFVQLKDAREDKSAAEQRVEHALFCAAEFPAFFEKELRKPLDLKRSLPASLTQQQRDAAPIVVKLFKDASHWQAYMRDRGYKSFDGLEARTATEPGSGHVSLVFTDQRSSMGAFIRALVDVVLYNHHPRPPVTLEEDKNFRAYSAWFLEAFLHTAISMTRARVSGQQLTALEFMFNDPDTAKALGRWKKPFEKDADQRVVSFGGSLLTARDFLESKSPEDLEARTKARMEKIPGWTEPDLMLYADPRQLRAINGWYFRGFYSFLFHWGPDGKPKYRERLLKFIRADLDGEVDKDNPIAAFEKAFGLDAAGWKKLEADWLAYQTD
jgi:hypothetical protein